MQVNGTAYQTFSDQATNWLNRLRPAQSAVRQTVTRVAAKTYKTGSEYFETGKKVFDGAFHLIAAVVLGIGSALGATFAKDNTAFDWLSKIGIVIAVTFGGMGIFKLLKREKETKIIVQDPAVKVSDDVSLSSKDAYNKVKEVDKAYQEPLAKDASRFASYDKNDAHNLRERAFKLFDSYKAGLEYLRPRLDIVERNEGQSLLVSNFTDTPKSLSDVQYENAILAAYVIASRQQSYESDDLCKKLALVLEPNGVREANSDLFPGHFNVVYTNARLYDEFHRRDNNSLSNVFKLPSGVDKLEDIPDIVNGAISDKRTAVIEYLKSVQNTRNNLKVLEKAISYINENLSTTDANKRRELNILRASLVAGFRLQGDEGAINASLGEILRGVSTQTGESNGLSTKVNQLNEQYAKLDTEVLSKVSPTLPKVSKPTDDVFTSDLGLCELKPAVI